MAAARAFSQHAARARAPAETRPGLGAKHRLTSAGSGAGLAEARIRTPPLTGGTAHSAPGGSEPAPLASQSVGSVSATLRPREFLHCSARGFSKVEGKGGVSLCPTRSLRCHFPMQETKKLKGSTRTSVSRGPFPQHLLCSRSFLLLGLIPGQPHPTPSSPIDRAGNQGSRT